ncbi:sortase [Jiangella alkaliphila]|uniref:LPXTG-site transpeptidase (Sortase) family protein n=1 Tax=Jiangella alkaliphila TaxID=419479 RepID=A0A1H2LIX8_9ACTN|nr:sortase [Jiangella alkaliphila]SDU80970.1 LPXTG-site transpeptidase (sortase) family protein [Jiangella alkaliphila]
MTTLMPPGTTDRTEPADPGPVHGGAPEPERVPPVAAPPPPSVPGDPPGDGEGGGRGGVPPSGQATPRPGQRKRTRVPSAAAYVPAVALQILAIVALGFIVHVVLLSQIQHDRDQQTAYADFRADLANAVAPVGQLAPPELPEVGPPGEETQEEAPDRLMALGTPVALLEIPALGVSEVVFEGTTSDVMRSGPGHRRDTVLPGQQGTSVVMGRRTTYGGPFSRINTLSAGDQITAVTGQGEHVYRVIGVRREGDPLPQPAAEGEGRLTLVTSDGRPLLPSGVLRVDAELVSDAHPAPPRSLTTPSLPLSEQTMATDEDAWYPLVLLGQGLLLAVAGTVWARNRLGHWQAWVVGIPVIAAFGLTTADQVARLLPNLL